jgi:hypothetical protein
MDVCVCVCLSGADGRVVEGRATLFGHHREVSRVVPRSPTAHKEKKGRLDRKVANGERGKAITKKN